MTSFETDPAAYVRKVAEEMQRSATELMRENERLSLALTESQNEREALQERIARVEVDLTTARSSKMELEAELRGAQDTHGDLHQRMAEAMSQTADLTNLYVASYQLHGTLDYTEVVRVIEEIVINLVGSEEFVILDLKSDGEAGEIIGSFGVELDRGCDHPIDNPTLTTAIRKGEIFVANGGPPEKLLGSPVTACVPLTLGGKPFGAIVVFSLLPQKPALAGGDLELFNLLATQAATALYCTRLHQQSA